MTAAEPAAPAVRRLADWDAARLAGLAAEYGTPLYVIDLDRVRANYRRFAAAFPDADRWYAVKANTGPGVLRTLYEAGAGLECAGPGELRRARAAGAAPRELQYTAVNPPDPHLDAVVEAWRAGPGLTVTAGAVDTLDRLADRGFDGRLAIRVNPGVGAGHHEKVATGTDAQFGIPAERAPAVVADARERFDVVGLHMHIGSGMLDADLPAYREALDRLAALADRVGPLEFVDVGGGFGVPYRDGDAPLDLEAVADTVRGALGTVDATIAVEPGRYLVADAGVLLTRVNTVKPAPETTVVGIDASLATLVRPAMFDAYHPIRNLSGGDRATEPVTVGGPVCSSADTFCTDRPIARPDREDLLAIGMAGAYGYELTSRFHSEPRPAEVALEDGTARVTRRAETYGDVLRGDRTR